MDALQEDVVDGILRTFAAAQRGGTRDPDGTVNVYHQRGRLQRMIQGYTHGVLGKLADAGELPQVLAYTTGNAAHFEGENAALRAELAERDAEQQRRDAVEELLRGQVARREETLQTERKQLWGEILFLRQQMSNEYTPSASMPPVASEALEQQMPTAPRRKRKVRYADDLPGNDEFGDGAGDADDSEEAFQQEKAVLLRKQKAMQQDLLALQSKVGTLMMDLVSTKKQLEKANQQLDEKRAHKGKRTHAPPCAEISTYSSAAYTAKRAAKQDAEMTTPLMVQGGAFTPAQQPAGDPLGKQGVYHGSGSPVMKPGRSTSTGSGKSVEARGRVGAGGAFASMRLAGPPPSFGATAPTSARLQPSTPGNAGARGSRGSAAAPRSPRSGGSPRPANPRGGGIDRAPSPDPFALPVASSPLDGPVLWDAVAGTVTTFNAHPPPSGQPGIDREPEPPPAHDVGELPPSAAAAAASTPMQTMHPVHTPGSTTRTSRASRASAGGSSSGGAGSAKGSAKDVGGGRGRGGRIGGSPPKGKALAGGTSPTTRPLRRKTQRDVSSGMPVGGGGRKAAAARGAGTDDESAAGAGMGSEADAAPTTITEKNAGDVVAAGPVPPAADGGGPVADGGAAAAAADVKGEDAIAGRDQVVGSNKSAGDAPATTPATPSGAKEATAETDATAGGDAGTDADKMHDGASSAASKAGSAEQPTPRKSTASAHSAAGASAEKVKGPKAKAVSRRLLNKCRTQGSMRIVPKLSAGRRATTATGGAGSGADAVTPRRERAPSRTGMKAVAMTTFDGPPDVAVGSRESRERRRSSVARGVAVQRSPSAPLVEGAATTNATPPPRGDGARGGSLSVTGTGRVSHAATTPGPPPHAGLVDGGGELDPDTISLPRSFGDGGGDDGGGDAASGDSDFTVDAEWESTVGTERRGSTNTAATGEGGRGKGGRSAPAVRASSQSRRTSRKLSAVTSVVSSGYGALGVRRRSSARRRRSRRSSDTVGGRHYADGAGGGSADSPTPVNPACATAALAMWRRACAVPNDADGDGDAGGDGNIDNETGGTASPAHPPIFVSDPADPAYPLYHVLLPSVVLAAAVGDGAGTSPEPGASAAAAAGGLTRTTVAQLGEVLQRLCGEVDARVVGIVEELAAMGDGGGASTTTAPPATAAVPPPPPVATHAASLKAIAGVACEALARGVSDEELFALLEVAVWGRAWWHRTELRWREAAREAQARAAHALRKGSSASQQQQHDAAAAAPRRHSCGDFFDAHGPPDFLEPTDPLYPVYTAVVAGALRVLAHADNADAAIQQLSEVVVLARARVFHDADIQPPGAAAAASAGGGEGGGLPNDDALWERVLRCGDVAADLATAHPLSASPVPVAVGVYAACLVAFAPLPAPPTDTALAGVFMCVREFVGRYALAEAAAAQQNAACAAPTHPRHALYRCVLAGHIRADALGASSESLHHWVTAVARAIQAAEHAMIEESLAMSFLHPFDPLHAAYLAGLRVAVGGRLSRATVAAVFAALGRVAGQVHRAANDYLNAGGGPGPATAAAAADPSGAGDPTTTAAAGPGDNAAVAADARDHTRGQSEAAPGHGDGGGGGRARGDGGGGDGGGASDDDGMAPFDAEVAGVMNMLRAEADGCGARERHRRSASLCGDADTDAATAKDAPLGAEAMRGGASVADGGEADTAVDLAFLVDVTHPHRPAFESALRHHAHAKIAVDLRMDATAVLQDRRAREAQRALAEVLTEEAGGGWDGDAIAISTTSPSMAGDVPPVTERGGGEAAAAAAAAPPSGCVPAALAGCSSLEGEGPSLPEGQDQTQTLHAGHVHAHGTPKAGGGDERGAPVPPLTRAPSQPYMGTDGGGEPHRGSVLRKGRPGRRPSLVDSLVRADAVDIDGAETAESEGVDTPTGRGGGTRRALFPGLDLQAMCEGFQTEYAKLAARVAAQKERELADTQRWERCKREWEEASAQQARRKEVRHLAHAPLRDPAGTPDAVHRVKDYYVGQLGERPRPQSVDVSVVPSRTYLSRCDEDDAREEWVVCGAGGGASAEGVVVPRPPSRTASAPTPCDHAATPPLHRHRSSPLPDTRPVYTRGATPSDLSRDVLGGGWAHGPGAATPDPHRHQPTPPGTAPPASTGRSTPHAAREYMVIATQVRARAGSR